MKISEFVALTIANASRTENVRAYAKTWYSGVGRVPNKYAYQIGQVINLLQQQIDQGLICRKDEYVLLYNFQPLHTEEESYLCSLDMVIKPRSLIFQTEKNAGIPIQLVINCVTGELWNDTKGMLEIGILTEEEVEEESLEPPQVFGKYIECTSLSCCLAIVTEEPLEDITVLFTGNIDFSHPVQIAPAVDTPTEAIDILSSADESKGRYIIECTFPKENIASKKMEGLSASITKVISYPSKIVMLNPYQRQEIKLYERDQKVHLNTALTELSLDQCFRAMQGEREADARAKDEMLNQKEEQDRL